MSTGAAHPVPVPIDLLAGDPIEVAPKLLNLLLVHGDRMARIVEVEAYRGMEDPASHAYRGPTKRNAVMFGPPGHAYVYFIYGNHYCLNVSCLPDGVPGGVLFRALEPITGIEQMAEARGVDLPEKPELRKLSILKKISSGPGRMSEALGVTRARDNDKSLVSARSDLRIVDDGYRVRRVVVSPRIGIVKAADHPLRYFIAGNPFVS